MPLISHHFDMLFEIARRGKVNNFHFELFVDLGVLIFDASIITLFAFVSRTPLKRPVLRVFFTMLLFPAEGFHSIKILVDYVLGVKSAGIK